MIAPRQIASLPLADNVPRHGVRTGPREMRWIQGQGARLLWIQALDEGNPANKVPFRDSIWRCDAASPGSADLVLQTAHRVTNIQWLEGTCEIVLTQTDQDKRCKSVELLNLEDQPPQPKLLFDFSTSDAYRHPGDFLLRYKNSSREVIQRSAQQVWLAGDGFSSEGACPFLDSLNLQTLQRTRIFTSTKDQLEHALGLSVNHDYLLIQRQSVAEQPTLWLEHLSGKKSLQLTHSALQGALNAHMTKETVTYTRNDGVALSGTLYLPKDRKSGARLPLLIWAYPREFADKELAGQLRTSQNAYVRPVGASAIYLASQGWAVLMEAAMPIVGDVQTMNDTFIEQTVASAQAAINYLHQREVIDTKKVVIGGHSYGAFMAVNLLAHTNLFAAGIARNGAYNRSLTPFGFQQERRSYWDAMHTYTQISPFTHVPKISAPLLIIHGAEDSNQGTHPMQSERLYAAMAGNGLQSKLVMLPCEGHTYKAKETILHVVAEMLEWGQRWTAGTGAVDGK